MSVVTYAEGLPTKKNACLALTFNVLKSLKLSNLSFLKELMARNTVVLAGLTISNKSLVSNLSVIISFMWIVLRKFSI